MTLPPAAILPASFHALPLLGLTSSLRFQKYRHQQDAPTGWVLAILQETLPRALCPHMGFWKPRRSYISPATTNRGHAPTRVILKEREKTHIFAASGISFLICEASTPAAITCSLIFSRSDRTLLSAGTMLKARETSCIMAAKKQSGPCGNTTRPEVDALAPAWSCSALQGFCPGDGWYEAVTTPAAAMFLQISSNACVPLPLPTHVQVGEAPRSLLTCVRGVYAPGGLKPRASFASCPSHQET